MTTPTELAAERWLGRRGAVHLTESGRDDRAAALTRSLGPNCKRIVRRTFADCVTAAQFEVLLLPAGSDGYTCCLHARPVTDIPGTIEPQPIEPAEASTTTIARAAEDLLPELYGVETGDLWLRPLMSGYALTCRAVETTADWSLSSESSPFRAIERWAQEHDRTPLLGQLLIDNSPSPPYNVTLRVLQLTERPPTHRQALGTLLADGVVSPQRVLGDAPWEMSALPTLAVTRIHLVPKSEWEAK